MNRGAWRATQSMGSHRVWRDWAHSTQFCPISEAKPFCICSFCCTNYEIFHSDLGDGNGCCSRCSGLVPLWCFSAESFPDRVELSHVPVLIDTQETARGEPRAGLQSPSSVQLSLLCTICGSGREKKGGFIYHWHLTIQTDKNFSINGPLLLFHPKSAQSRNLNLYLSCIVSWRVARSPILRFISLSVSLWCVAHLWPGWGRVKALCCPACFSSRLPQMVLWQECLSCQILPRLWDKKLRLCDGVSLV